MERLLGTNATNRIESPFVPQSQEKMDSAISWYKAFANNGRASQPIEEDEQEEAYYHAKVLSATEGHFTDALAIYDALLKSELERHEKRQIQAETGSLLIRLARDSKSDTRKQYLKRAKNITNELLWVQDVWFGKAVTILAHVYLLQGDYDKALKLLDDYRPQLREIDKALRLQSTTEDDLTELSPVAEVRYITGVALHEKAKNLIAQNGEESEILKLLIGDRNPEFTGAFIHFLNVAIQYPTSEWVSDSAQRAAAIGYILDKRYDRKVKF
jgi:hypothetical protein